MRYLTALARRMSFVVPEAAKVTAPMRAIKGSSPAVAGRRFPPARACLVLLDFLPVSPAVACDGAVVRERVAGSDGAVVCAGSVWVLFIRVVLVSSPVTAFLTPCPTASAP